MKNIAQPQRHYTIRYKYDVIEIDTPVFTIYSFGLSESEAKENFQRRFPTAIVISCHEVKLKN